MRKQLALEGTARDGASNATRLCQAFYMTRSKIERKEREAVYIIYIHYVVPYPLDKRPYNLVEILGLWRIPGHQRAATQASLGEVPGRRRSPGRIVTAFEYLHE